jgi:WD repeat-containing protein 23
MDTRYLISNSKDQSIKLWDMRRFADGLAVDRSRKISNSINHGWDYRYDNHGHRRKSNL